MKQKKKKHLILLSWSFCGKSVIAVHGEDMDQPTRPAPKPCDTLVVTDVAIFPAKVQFVAQGTKNLINNFPPDSEESYIFLLFVFRLKIKLEVAALLCCSLEQQFP